MNQQCVPLRGNIPSRVGSREMTPINVLPDDLLLDLFGRRSRYNDADKSVAIPASAGRVDDDEELSFGSPRLWFYLLCAPETLLSFAGFSSITGCRHLSACAYASNRSDRNHPCGSCLQRCKVTVAAFERKGVGHLFVGNVKAMSDTRR